MLPEGVWGQRRQWRLCWKGRKAPNHITKKTVSFLRQFFLLLSLPPAGGKALAAVYGAVLLGFKRNLSGLSAFRADSVKHLTRSAGSTAGLTRLTAGLAAGGLVLESLFGIEFLFTGSENELSATVFAYQRFVFVHG